MKGRPANCSTGLFGPTRRLYKRLAQFSHFQEQLLYEQLARQPYPWLRHARSNSPPWPARRWAAASLRTKCCSMLRPSSAKWSSTSRFTFPKEARYRPLADVSPVVQSLATGQFDDYVKRVRIFVHPRLADDLRRLPNVSELVHQAITRME